MRDNKNKATVTTIAFPDIQTGYVVNPYAPTERLRRNKWKCRVVGLREAGPDEMKNLEQLYGTAVTNPMSSECQQPRQPGSAYCYYHHKVAQGLMQPLFTFPYPRLPLPEYGYKTSEEQIHE